MAEISMRVLSTLAFVGVCLFSGCATMIRGTTQRVTVITDPAGARCTVAAAETEGVRTIPETPGTVEVGRGRRPLAVGCAMAGYLDTVERIEALAADQFSAETPEQRTLLAGSGAALAIPLGAPQAMLLIGAATPAAAPLVIGLLLAEPVTLLVDLSSGALYGYPSTIVVLMVPANFRDGGARDAYFADLERRFEAALQKRRQENDAYCRTASTFELVQWKCDRLRQQEAAFLAERTQWLAEARAKAAVTAPSGTSP